jgi:hypothetical protein
MLSFDISSSSTFADCLFSDLIWASVGSMSNPGAMEIVGVMGLSKGKKVDTDSPVGVW